MHYQYGKSPSIPSLTLAHLAIACAAVSTTLITAQLTSALDSDQSRSMDPASRAMHALAQVADCPPEPGAVSDSCGWDAESVESLAHPDLYAEDSFVIDTRITSDDILQAIGNAARGDRDPWHHCRQDLLDHEEFRCHGEQSAEISAHFLRLTETESEPASAYGT